MKITAEHIPPGHDLVGVVDGEAMFRETKCHMFKSIREAIPAWRPLIASLLRDGWRREIAKRKHELRAYHWSEYAATLNPYYNAIAAITAWEKDGER